MSTLVGYGSSDDENEAPIPASTSKPHKEGAAVMNGSVNGVSSGREPVIEPHNVTNRAMVGPSMPNDANPTIKNAYEDDAEQELPPMSERDLLRYLTQPSHPIASLPPETTSDADLAVTARFKRFLELKAKGVHFNDDLASKSSFKNPSLFASLLERSGATAESQYASTVPSEVFSTKNFPSWAFKEELLKSQQALSAELEATKKAQSAGGKRKIEFTSPGNLRSGDGTPKRSQR